MVEYSPAQLIDRRYIIQKMLGRGGMGVVFHVTDRLFNKDVALKQVLADPQGFEFSTSYGISDYRLSLAREFKLSASLRHPNIVEVLDYGFDQEEKPYYTMEVLNQPKSILDYALEHPISLRLELILQLLNAVAYLHRRGIVHRDLKPANVLIENGQVKVLDFGLSVIRDHISTSEDQAEITAGTLAYISPEVLMGETPAPTSDLYTIGLMGYEMIAGHHPFDVSKPGLLVNQIIADYPDPEQLDVKQEVANVFMRLLHKDPVLRYTTAQEVIEELDGLIHNTQSVNHIAIRESFLQAAKLVGRDSELRQLRDALDQAVDHTSSIWLVAGESGVGKSRLLEELRTHALVKGVLVMRGMADRVGSRPYELWLSILRWIAMLMEDLSDDDINFLSRFILDLDSLLGIDSHDQSNAELKPQEIKDYIISLLRRLGNQLNRPILIMLEDLHWAGDESLNVLYEVSTHIASIPSMMIIASFRDDENTMLIDALPDVPLLKLQRLNKEKIAELSVAMLGEAGSQEHVIRLLERETEGNIFFLIEVVRALAEEVGQLDQIGRVTLPERVFAGGIQTVINRRLDQIDPAGRELLKIASAMGRILNSTLLQAIEPNMNLNYWLTDCLNAAVLEVKEGFWSFAHDKLRTSVLHYLEVEELQLIHKKIANVMEKLYGSGTSHINLLAEHWGQAGDLERESYYLILAANDELRIGLYDPAIQKFERVLSNLERGDARRLEVQLNIAQAHLGLGDYQAARMIYDDALQHTGDDQRLSAQILMMLGDVFSAEENLVRAEEYYQQSFTQFETLNDTLGIAESLNRLGNVAYEQGDEGAANRYFQRSLALSRDTGDQRLMAGAVQYDTSSTVIDTSEYEQVKEFLEHSLREYEQDSNHAGIADVLMNLGTAAQASGKYEDAEEYYNRSLSIRTNLQDDAGLSQLYNHLSRLKQAQDDYDLSRQFARMSLEHALKSDETGLMFAPISTIGTLHIEQGELVEGLRLLTFLAYAPNVPERLQDRVERQIMELEVKIPDNEFEQAWADGKALTNDELIKQLLD